MIVATFLSCTPNNTVDANSIINQLPDNIRPVLVPDEIANQLTGNIRIISFSDMDSIQTSINQIYNEDQFYQKVREMGVQYIVISSKMTLDTAHNFPWISNRNFQVCPGDADHKSETFYTLLVWDNSKNSYHFFKYLYPE